LDPEVEAKQADAEAAGEVGPDAVDGTDLDDRPP
nr:transcriptional regulator [Streptomyces sp. SID7803]